METNPIGIYVHIPFCVRKCNYCDFCSEAAGKEKKQRYADALCKEIKEFAIGKKISVDSVFFGGGTPSVLDAASLKKIILAIRKSFDVLPKSEVTVEVNPGTVTEEKAKAFVEAGINRVSIGVQSIHENELKKLGRIHGFEDFLNTYKLFKEVGIDNLSVDLMYGIPGQTVSSFQKTLEKIIELSPEHVSCYGLIIEEGTPFFEMKDELDLPSEDDEYEMYLLAHEMLSEYGYSHYEISNYAKYGRKSRHNLKYWHSEEYVGFGLSAHSYYGGKRFYNTSDFTEYFESDGAKYRKSESEVTGIDPFEYAMLALRLDEGISLSDYERLFGVSFLEGKEKRISELSALGLLKTESDRLFLTHKGFYVSNSILSDLL